ncbi:MAG: peroxiredoxin family protein [Actinomycetota bacterium]|nr:peroxiredoxin family protein [Actinomycetota bacterium]
MVVVGLGVLFFGIYRHAGSTSASAPRGGYAVGKPGPGGSAPDFSLRSTTGGTVSLSQFRGRTVLLYFQEGITCQPCFDQLTELQQAAGTVRAAGVDQVLSVTTDPVDVLTQKAHDMGITIPILSDPQLAASHAYHANGFGMMGGSRDGHTFILVGPDGTIRWRADYGGAPNYTMNVAVPQLLAQLRAGERPV